MQPSIASDKLPIGVRRQRGCILVAARWLCAMSSNEQQSDSVHERFYSTAVLRLTPA